MTDDVERMLKELTPREASPQSREAVLGAVARELSISRPSRWLRRSCLAAAALLLLGVGLNWWAVQAEEARMARLFGPVPVPRPVAEVSRAVESVTDAETARWVRQQFAAARRAQARPTPPWVTLEQLSSLEPS